MECFVEFTFVNIILDKCIEEEILLEGDVSWNLSQYGDSKIAEIEDEGIKYKIIFSEHTYEVQKELLVQIYSDNPIDNVCKNDFMEKLKLKIKNNFLSKSDKCIWLYDKEAEKIASYLYSKIFICENLIRRFINEVMYKTIGINWVYHLPLVMLEKIKIRKKGYGKAVINFKDVDESLLSIDLLDLIEILKLEKKKLKLNLDVSEIEKILNREKILKEEKLFEILESQTEIRVNFWDEYFSKYLDRECLEKMEIMSKDRNHVAHNKILDKSSANNIERNLNTVISLVNEGLVKISRKLISEERKDVLMMIEEERSEYISAKIEMESGVYIRRESEIYNLFLEAIFQLKERVFDEFRFRENLIIFPRNIEEKEEKQIIFEIEDKLKNTNKQIYCQMFIDDSEGVESELKIIIEDEEFVIFYTNGKAEYNREQMTYMPEIQDEFNEEENERVFDNIIKYIDEKYEDKRQEIDNLNYLISRGEIENPVHDLECKICGEQYICKNEKYGKLGQCLNCGEENTIKECVCGVYHNEEGEFCNYCNSKMESERN